MKKYPVSKFYIGVFGIDIFIVIAWEVLLVWATEESVKREVFYYALHAMGVVAFFIGLYLIFFDLPTAKFSFSNESITMYVGFKKHETRWSEFAYAGIVAENPGIKSRTPSDTFWVYFSKDFLTDKEKLHFLRKTRKDQTRIAYFQYSKPVFDMILEKLPENLRSGLKSDEETIIGEMRFWEKVYNK